MTFANAQILDKLELFNAKDEDKFEKAKDYIRTGSRIKIEKKQYEIEQDSNQMAKPVVFKFSEIPGFKNEIKSVSFQGCENITVAYGHVKKSANISSTLPFDLDDSLQSDFVISLINPEQKGVIKNINFNLKDTDRLLILNRIRNLEIKMKRALDSEERKAFQKDLASLSTKITGLENLDERQKATLLKARYVEILRLTNQIYNNLNDAKTINEMGDAMYKIVDYLSPSSQENFVDVIRDIENNLEEKEKKDRVLSQLEILKQGFGGLENQLSDETKTSRGFEFVTNSLNIITGGNFSSILTLGKSFLSLLSSENKEAEKNLQKAYDLIVEMEIKAQKLKRITGQFSGINFDQHKTIANTYWKKMCKIGNKIDQPDSSRLELSKIFIEKTKQQAGKITQAIIDDLSAVINNDSLSSTDVNNFEKDINDAVKALDQSIIEINSDLSYLKAVLELLQKETNADLKHVIKDVEKTILTGVTF